jgi:hypothetical protein
MIKLIKDKNNNPIGWEMNPTTEEEQKIAASIRDLQYFGMNEEKIEYNGLKLIDPDKGKTLGNIKSISWLQKKHHK